MRYEGTVIFFKEKFGFLTWKKNEKIEPDLFVHYSDLEMSGFRELKKGQKVSFALGENNTQKLKAIQVRVEK